MDDYETRAVLRRFPAGDIIALFPDQEGSRSDLCGSYQHIGQHGDASRSLTRETKPVDPSAEDAAALLRELAQIGYRIRLLKRMPRR